MVFAIHSEGFRKYIIIKFFKNLENLRKFKKLRYGEACRELKKLSAAKKTPLGTLNQLHAILKS